MVKMCVCVLVDVGAVGLRDYEFQRAVEVFVIVSVKESWCTNSVVRGGRLMQAVLIVEVLSR
jgi:hypothetical protein